MLETRPLTDGAARLVADSVPAASDRLAPSAIPVRLVPVLDTNAAAAGAATPALAEADNVPPFSDKLLPKTTAVRAVPLLDNSGAAAGSMSSLLTAALIVPPWIVTLLPAVNRSRNALSGRRDGVPSLSRMTLSVTFSCVSRGKSA